MYKDSFAPATDFKSAFVGAVDELLAADMPTPWRIKAVDDLTAAYLEQTGQRPDAYQLSRLADYILRDDLSDPHPDKVSNTEYPFLSEGQFKLRRVRENSSGEGVAKFTKNSSQLMNGTRRGVHYITEE